MKLPKLTTMSLLLGIGALVLGQVLKSIFIWKIPEQGIFLLNKDWLSCQLKLVSNPFIAFSLPIPALIIYGLSLVFLLGLVYFLIQNIKTNQVYLSISLSILTGAALSNLLDRIINGGVIDYFNITIYNYHWATFNLADSLIVICALIIIIKNFKSKI